MDDPPPKDAFVERRCLNGTWENIPTRSLEMLYSDCKIPPDLVADNSFDVGFTL